MEVQHQNGHQKQSRVSGQRNWPEQPLTSVQRGGCCTETLMEENRQQEERLRFSQAPFTQPAQRRVHAPLTRLAGLFTQHGRELKGPSCSINYSPSEVASEASQQWSRGRATPVRMGELGGRVRGVYLNRGEMKSKDETEL